MRASSLFQPGTSGNPGGRPRLPPELVEAARGHTAEALAVIVKVMRDGKRLSTRLRAAEMVLDRGCGRAPLSISVDLQARVGLAAVSAAEWEALSLLRHAVRPTLPASEAVVEVVSAMDIPSGGRAPSDNERQVGAINEGDRER